MRIQYELSGLDITGDRYAKADADTIRIWDGEVCLIEVTHVRDDGLMMVWAITGSDVGNCLDWDGEFETWQDALASQGVDYRDFR